MAQPEVPTTRKQMDPYTIAAIGFLAMMLALLSLVGYLFYLSWPRP